MKVLQTAPIAIILTLVLGALPAAAADRGHPLGPPALERLSFELAQATAVLYREVAESRRPHTHARWGALRALARLDRDATSFHRNVKREGAFDRDTRRAFRQLEDSFRVASAQLPVGPKRHAAAHDLAHVAQLLERVEIRMARVDDRHDQRHQGFGDSGAPGIRIGWNQPD